MGGAGSEEILSGSHPFLLKSVKVRPSDLASFRLIWFPPTKLQSHSMKRASNSLLRYSIFATAIATALLVCAPARANSTLLITQMSEADLTVTLDGTAFGTVINVGPNHWEWRSDLWGNGQYWQSPDTGWYDTKVGTFWTDPSDATKGNFVGPTGFFYPYNIPSITQGFAIYTEVAAFRDTSFFNTPNPSVANGALGMADLRIIGVDFDDVVAGPWDVYFSDNSHGASTVPDNSSTIALLAFSCSAAVIARRRRTAS
jgi:hypothetical protein